MQPKEVGGGEKLTKPKTSRREEIRRVSAEINEIENRKAIEKKSKKSKVGSSKISTKLANLKLDGLRKNSRLKLLKSEMKIGT